MQDEGGGLVLHTVFTPRVLRCHSDPLLPEYSIQFEERTRYLIRAAREKRQQDVAFPLARITTCAP